MEMENNRRIIDWAESIIGEKEEQEEELQVMREEETLAILEELASIATLLQESFTPEVQLGPVFQHLLLPHLQRMYDDISLYGSFVINDNEGVTTKILDTLDVEEKIEELFDIDNDIRDDII